MKTMTRFGAVERMASASAVAVTLALLLTEPAHAAEIWLRAATLDLAMPDGTVVPMWGFARDSAFGAHDGTPSVPGPELRLAPGDASLIVHLENDLDVPVSFVLEGQALDQPGTPVRNPDGRVRSFTHETPAGNAAPVDYAFTVAPGTYLYHSGAHVAVQVQMGLYGAAVRETPATRSARRRAGAPGDVTVLFSEIDPDLHQAVASGDYGPGKTVTSTLRYLPRFFLINGLPFAPGASAPAPLAAGPAGRPLVVRLLNAGLQTRVPQILGLPLTITAEGGHTLAHPKEQLSVILPALGTAEARVTAPANGSFPVYDRRLAVSNGPDAPGGMLRYLEFSTPPRAAVRPPRSASGALRRR